MANPPHLWQNVAPMQTTFVEATNIGAGGLNWGKFMVGWFTSDEWATNICDEAHTLTGKTLLAGRRQNHAH